MCSQDIPSSFLEPEAHPMSTLGTQEKIQAPVGFFNKSIRGKINEIIKKWASMIMFILFTCAGILDKWGGREEGSKQGRLMGTTVVLLIGVFMLAFLSLSSVRSRSASKHLITHLQKPHRPNRCSAFQDIASASHSEPCT